MTGLISILKLKNYKVVGQAHGPPLPITSQIVIVPQNQVVLCIEAIVACCELMHQNIGVLLLIKPMEHH